jgi:16S rRNA (cytosine1402-N4)-methyltransferase
MLPEHSPVMVDQVLEYLSPSPGARYVDATLGLGGHARAILDATGDEAELVGIERDPDSLAAACRNLSNYRGFRGIHGRISGLAELIGSPCRGILLDLGVSSRQLSSPSYGISFSEPALSQPLDMRLDPWCTATAADIVNGWSEPELARMFAEHADYRGARRLAKRIAEARPLQTLGDFVRLCGPRRGRLHPATLPLQALRITVNDELGELQAALAAASKILEPGGRLVVISFHSGEDRMVKHHLRQDLRLGVLTPKPIRPSLSESKTNPRARSAKLRAAEADATPSRS